MRLIQILYGVARAHVHCCKEALCIIGAEIIETDHENVSYYIHSFSGCLFALSAVLLRVKRKLANQTQEAMLVNMSD